MGFCGGSSPRMWGTLYRFTSLMTYLRFIPTHVGNTAEGKHRRHCQPVHPHACGEHSGASRSFRYQAGSSPRMWGNTHISVRCDFVFAVHPHACGEHQSKESTASGGIGSSPRMWEHATRPSTLSARAVHPHACGEHVGLAMATHSETGSSPRMWGTHHRGPLKQSMGRFIPTHVGNTASTAAGSGRLPVHPHACGEHSQGRRSQFPAAGSSPRMWGTPT